MSNSNEFVPLTNEYPAGFCYVLASFDKHFAKVMDATFYLNSEPTPLALPAGQDRPTRSTLTDRQIFVASIEQQHGNRLRRFLASRLRHRAADVPDLVQEVFVRLLRIERHHAIRSSEAYVFTVASRVLHQYTLRRSKMGEPVDIATVSDQIESPSEADPAAQLEIQQCLCNLRAGLEKLSPRAAQVLMLHRRDGFSLEEIGAQLGISRTAAKKDLGKALLYYRAHIQ